MAWVFSKERGSMNKVERIAALSSLSKLNPGFVAYKSTKRYWVGIILIIGVFLYCGW